MTPFIESHFNRLDRGTPRRKDWPRMRGPFMRGLQTAWKNPKILTARLPSPNAKECDVSATEREKEMFDRLAGPQAEEYRVAALLRLANAQPDLPDINAFFAAVCLGSVGLWSGDIDRARPAADLVSNDLGGSALSRLLAQVVLNFSQPGGNRGPGRPSAGLLEEIRDLGMAAMRSDFESVALQAEHFGKHERDMQKLNAKWRV